MSDLVTRIEAVLEPPTDELLVWFFDPARPFAATTFDDLPDNARDRVTVSDLLAVTLLDMRIRPRAVRAMLHDKAEDLSRLLRWSTTSQRTRRVLLLFTRRVLLLLTRRVLACTAIAGA